MGLLIVLFALFLLVLAALGFASVRLFAVRGSDGKRDPAGCLVGCAVGAGLLALGALGLGAFVLALLFAGATRALSLNPVQRIYLGTEPERVPGYESGTWEPAPGQGPLFPSDPSRPLHVVLEIDGHDFVPDRMTDWIREWSDGEAAVRVAETAGADGRPCTLVDVALPADWRDLREIESQVRKVFPEASWARGLRIELKGISRDW